MSRRLKFLIKSKSFGFVKDLQDKSHSLKSIKWNGKKVFYRTSSSDMKLIYEILLKSKDKAEYFFPEELSPKVIFDIGGNVGITSIYLANIFPDALIYTFEPMPDNFKILQKNIEKYVNIKAFNIGLGVEDGDFKVYLSDDSENYGGVTFYPEAGGSLDTPYILCKVRNINKVLEEHKIQNIDLIKIDTEGAEHDILTSLNVKVLKNTSWITGELHGNQDFELLAYLNKLGFRVSYKKLIDERLSIFHAGKLKIISQMNRKDIKRLL